MPQNRESGAAGSEFGHENAPRIAAAIGAELTRPGSNEATWSGKRAVIKSAGKHTTSVGVTYSMLEHIELVIAAFQHKTGAFEVYALPASRYTELATDSRSSEHVGIVTRKVFVQEGQRIKIVKG